MNKHIFLDNLTASVGALIAVKKKFFAKSIESATLEEHVSVVNLTIPLITGEGIVEVKAGMLRELSILKS